MMESPGKKDSAVVEQGSRDSLQLAIDALTRARDAKVQFELCDHVHTAVDEIVNALKIQRVGFYYAGGFSSILASLIVHER